MSRDYEEFCPECKRFSARKEIINEDVSPYLDNSVFLLQCLEKDCGACFKVTRVTEYDKLETKGTSDSDWKKAEKEIG